MKNFILTPSAAPIYGFLSFIHSQKQNGDELHAKKILDCGAGGSNPPLALFHKHGFDTWGIDISEEQLDRARHFCQENGIEIQIREGDMRHIPFADETFDYVYEHYSMCHLNKADSAAAVLEMKRSLKPQGLCFLGVISTDTWPKSLFGEEREPGEYWGEEDGNPDVLHSMFSDKEADQLATGWEILIKEKQVRYLRDAADQLSLDDWMGLLPEVELQYTEESWRERYTDRKDVFRYAHLYYLMKKTES